MKRSNAPLFSLALVALAFVATFAYAIPGYRSYVDLGAQNSALQAQLGDKKKVLAALKDAAAKADKDLVLKYLNNFREDSVIETLFGAASATDYAIGDFSLSEGGAAANGLYVGNVAFSPVFRGMGALRSYLENLSRQGVVIASVSISREKSGRDEIVRAPMTLAVYYAK